MDFDSIPEKPQLPLEEEKVVAFWKEIDAFQNCLKQSKNSQRYVKRLLFKYLPDWLVTFLHMISRFVCCNDHITILIIYR